MKTSENIETLIGALAKAKSEIPTIPMNGVNTFFKNTNKEGSKYSTLTDLFTAVNPVLSKNGLVLTQCPSSHEGRISIKTTLFHTSGQWLQNEGTPIKPDKDTAQGIASTITYGKRQEAFAILGLAGDADDDGNESSGLKVPQGEPPKPPTPPKEEPKTAERILLEYKLNVKNEAIRLGIDQSAWAEIWKRMQEKNRQVTEVQAVFDEIELTKE